PAYGMRLRPARITADVCVPDARMDDCSSPVRTGTAVFASFATYAPASLWAALRCDISISACFIDRRSSRPPRTRYMPLAIAFILLRHRASARQLMANRFRTWVWL